MHNGIEIHFLVQSFTDYGLLYYDGKKVQHDMWVWPSDACVAVVDGSAGNQSFNGVEETVFMFRRLKGEQVLSLCTLYCGLWTVELCRVKCLMCSV